MARRKVAPVVPTIASVHRFRDVVGVYAGDGAGGTVYLSAAEAKAVGQAMVDAAESIGRESFVDSNVAGVTIRADSRFN